MLVQDPYKVGDTVSFKTVAGEEIIARLTHLSDAKIKVKKPLALTMTEKGLGLVPFTFTVSQDTELELNRTTIVFIAKTEKAMADQYIEKTTGIKLA